MKVLITGGAGYIGSHVALEAIDKGFDVTIFDNLSTGNESNINPDACFIYGSTTSRSNLKKLFRSKKFDAVIHLAASKAAGESMIDPLKYAENNMVGSINLIKYCLLAKINIFIFSSTAAVYGEPKYLPIDEYHQNSPSNYYGFTKLEIEKNLKWLSQLKDFNYAALRYFNVAGYDVNNRIKSLEISPQNLIPKVMEAAVGIRKKIKIYGQDYNTEDGTGVRDYIHVTDIAKAHIQSINYLKNFKKNITVNLGVGRGYSVLEVINKTIQITQKKIKFEYVERRKGDPDEVVSISKKAENTIGWIPEYSDLDTLLKSTWNIYKIKF